MTRHRVGVITALLALLTVSPAAADGVVLYRGAAQGCIVQVTANAQWQTIAVQLEKPAGTGLSCRLERADILDALAGSLSALEAEGDDIAYRSFFLGRIVDYKWLSRHLAEAAARSADWSSAAGKPNNGATLNSFAAGLLAEPEILAATTPPPRPPATASQASAARRFSSPSPPWTPSSRIGFRPARACPSMRSAG